MEDFSKIDNFNVMGWSDKLRPFGPPDIKYSRIFHVRSNYCMEHYFFSRMQIFQRYVHVHVLLVIL